MNVKVLLISHWLKQTSALYIKKRGYLTFLPLNVSFPLTLQARPQFWPRLTWRSGKRRSQWLAVEFRRAFWTKRWNLDLFEGERFFGKVNQCISTDKRHDYGMLNACCLNWFLHAFVSSFRIPDNNETSEGWCSDSEDRHGLWPFFR